MVFCELTKKDQFLLGKSLSVYWTEKEEVGGVYWIELMGSCLREEGRKDPLFASSCSLQGSWFIVGKSSKLFLRGFFYTYTVFVPCMDGLGCFGGEEEKSSSNKRSTCSVTTWSSVISAGSVLFFIFKSLCAFTAAHFFGCCCFFSKLLETRSLKINGGCLWLKHPLRFPCR